MALTLTVPSTSSTNFVTARLTSDNRAFVTNARAFTLHRADTDAQLQARITIGSAQRDGSDYYFDISVSNTADYRGAVYLRLAANQVYDYVTRGLVPSTALESSQFYFSTAPLRAAPSSFAATAAQRSVTLTWNAVSGSVYEVRQVGGNWSDATSPHEVTGLLPETAYTFEVRLKAFGSTLAGNIASLSVTTLEIPAGPLSIESIDEQTIPVGTQDYELAIDIGGKPTEAYVDGDMQGFYYTWDEVKSQLVIKSQRVTRIVGNLEWQVHISRGDKSLSATIIYSVVPIAPVIEDVGRQTLLKGIPFDLDIPIANSPTISMAAGLLTGLKHSPAVDGVKGLNIAGVLPATAVTKDAFNAKIYAENLGGNDTLDIPFAIKTPDDVLFGLSHIGYRLLDIKGYQDEFYYLDRGYLSATSSSEFEHFLGSDDTYIYMADTALASTDIRRFPKAEISVENDDAVVPTTLSTNFAGVIRGIASDGSNIFLASNSSSVPINVFGLGGGNRLRYFRLSGVTASAIRAIAVDGNSIIVAHGTSRLNFDWFPKGAANNSTATRTKRISIARVNVGKVDIAVKDDRIYLGAGSTAGNAPSMRFIDKNLPNNTVIQSITNASTLPVPDNYDGRTYPNGSFLGITA